MGWVKPTSFHCVIELLGVCVNEGKREILQVRLCAEREGEREKRERERERERELEMYV